MRLPLRLASKSARRTTAWSLFGITGLLLTATWAASVSTTSPGSSSAAAPSPALGSAPAGDTAALDGFISTTTMDTAVPMDFSGRWGNIPADAVDDGANDPAAGGDWELFEVDLTSFAATRDFYVQVAISNAPDDFTALQLEFVAVKLPCATADLDNTGATGYQASTLYVETTDSTAVFTFPNSGGAGNVYCIGVADTGGVAAQDANGTFIRRAVGDNNAPNPMPAFFAILGEYSV